MSKSFAYIKCYGHPEIMLNHYLMYSITFMKYASYGSTLLERMQDSVDAM